MEHDKQYSIIKEDGGILGPANRDSLRRWAEQGSIGVNDTLALFDGRRMSVMEDDDLRVLVEAAHKAAAVHPGRRDILLGVFLFGVAGLLTVFALVAPHTLNMTRGFGTYEVSQVYFWILMGMLAIGGGTMLIRGYRERRRARLMQAEIF